jgi:16S rRNA (adenine1518-N6/adenine1519-N6)-dimethyltransferase
MNSVRPRRSLGQNFLVDGNIQRAIVDALEPGATDEVLEIGPGRGALTRHLAGRVHRLTVIEKDPVLAAQLERQLAGTTGLSMIVADALRTPPAVAGDPERLKIIGNIPYNITSPLLFHLLDRPHRPALIVIMVQAEVADRILARPGTGEYGALSVGVRAVAHVERVMRVGRDAFRPRPGVDSAVLRITPIRPFPLTAQEEDDLRSLTRTAFAWRRKQLGHTLRAAPGYGLDEHAVEHVVAAAGAAPRDRAETLDPAAFIRLARALRARGLPHPESVA